MTKAAFVTALGGATAAIGAGETATFAASTDLVTIAAHGRATGDGPFTFVNTGGALPGNLATNVAADAATGTLPLTPGAIVDDVVQIGGVYYQWAVDPTTGTPTGLVGAPYLVAVGASDTAALANLRKAINLTGVAGTDYAAETVIHPTVTSGASDATTLSVAAKVAGAAGNAISTTRSGNDGTAWGATTLTGGADAGENNFWLHVESANTFKLARTQADALANTSLVDVTTDGSGTNKMFLSGQGLADKIEDVVLNVLANGNRAGIPDVLQTRVWTQLEAAI